MADIKSAETLKKEKQDKKKTHKRDHSISNQIVDLGSTQFKMIKNEVALLNQTIRQHQEKLNQIYYAFHKATAGTLACFVFLLPFLAKLSIQPAWPVVTAITSLSFTLGSSTQNWFFFFLSFFFLFSFFFSFFLSFFFFFLHTYNN